MPANLRQLLLALVVGGAAALGFVLFKNAPQAPAARGRVHPAEAGSGTAATPAPAPPEKTTTYAAALAHLDHEIAFAVGRADKDPTSWLDLDNAASLTMARAKLTGDYDDYARAEALLAKAFERYGDKKGGPLLTRAKLNFSLHRFKEAEADLDRQKDVVVLTDDLAIGSQMLGADIALNLGRYAEAVAVWEQRLAKHAEFGSLLRLAAYRGKTGQLDQARRMFAEAQVMVADHDPQTIAFLELQRGELELEGGRAQEALEHFQAGDAALSGWWLIEEHIAEVWARTGKSEQALASTLELIERTHHPEMMAAAAKLYASAGDVAKAKEWGDKARAGFDALIARFPAAAAGHALEFYLEEGPPERALELARQNDAQRPNAEAKIGLAKAMLLAGDAAGARTAIDAALATPWRTADLFSTAAEVYDVLGDSAKAAGYTRQARALKPADEDEDAPSH